MKYREINFTKKKGFFFRETNFRRKMTIFFREIEIELFFYFSVI